MATSTSIEYKRVPITDLHEDLANARIHPEENMADIRASLKEFGQVEPLLVETSGKIISGNGRLQIMRELKFKEVLVGFVDLPPLKLTALGIAMNRAGERAKWDEAQLQKLIDEIKGDDGELEQMIAELEAELSAADGQETELKPIDVKAPPKMAWVLIGIPLVKFDQINQTIEQLATQPDVIIEMTTNDKTCTDGQPQPENQAGPTPPLPPKVSRGKKPKGV